LGGSQNDRLDLVRRHRTSRKSTLARGLAAHWFGLGHKPAIIDADPEGRLIKRYNPEGLLGAVPVIAEPPERVGEVIDEVRARHKPVIVDTAGFHNSTTISECPPGPSLASWQIAPEPPGSLEAERRFKSASWPISSAPIQRTVTNKKG
jgi:hypothetical protein